MRPNKIRQMWNERKPVTLGWLCIGNSLSAEAMACQGFDALCVDLEHGTTELASLLPMLQAISLTDTSPVVRVAWNDPSSIMKALDLGAYSVIVPMVNTAADAAKAVAACRYPPTGMRSYGPIRPAQYWGAEHAAQANNEILVMAMIETREGLDNLEAICATPGLDAIYIGPSDLSFALGLAPQSDNLHPLHMATCDRIRKAAHRHGLKACMHCASAGFAAQAIARGFDLVMLTSDTGSMVAGARRQLDDLKAALAHHASTPEGTMA
jgi:4-hydroxy-2-oxoheptanedioate aldolase